MKSRTRRYPDWEKRLDAHFTAARGARFQWGKFDCATAVCQAIAAITGIDPGADLRGQYGNSDEAAALMALSGGVTLCLEGASQLSAAGDLGTLAAALAAAHNFAEVKPTFARRGDLVLVDNNGGPTRALGIVDLSGRFAWCASERSFARVPMKGWLRAWRIE